MYDLRKTKSLVVSTCVGTDCILYIIPTPGTLPSVPAGFVRHFGSYLHNFTVCTEPTVYFSRLENLSFYKSMSTREVSKAAEQASTAPGADSTSYIEVWAPVDPSLKDPMIYELHRTPGAWLKS